jgi:RNA polymerase sigma-70 factor, ECF subfamily
LGIQKHTVKKFPEAGTFLFLRSQLVVGEREHMEEDYLKHASTIGTDSLRHLMEKYGEAVWQYAYFLTRRHHAADDISQDVFLKAYRNIADFRGESSVKTWLLKITRNTAYSYRRTAFFRKTVLTDEVSGPKSRSAEDEFLERHLANEIWRSVLRLPAIYREVLVLSAQQQLTTSEIAETLGITEGTVKSRIYRARAKAAKLMKGGVSNEENGKG